MPGKFAIVIDQYLNSPQFDRLAKATQSNWKRALLLAQKTMGRLETDSINSSIVQAHLDGLSDFPGKQEIAKAALKQVEKWALVRNILQHPITVGVETIGSDGGHEPWSDNEIETAITSARPDIGKAVALAINTGQRGSDIIKMRWSDIETHDGRTWVNVVTQKTKRQLSIPLLFGLQIDRWERKPPFYLVLAPDGRQFTRNRLSHDWAIERDTNEALAQHKERGLVLHGLRASTVIRLRMMGFTELEISSLIGMSEPMVARYSRLANQKKMALASVERIENFRGNNVSKLREKSE